MSPIAPSPSEDPRRRAVARAGFVLSAFAVFACGWLATRSSDWKMVALFSALAIGAAALASAFSRTTR